jgi:hypothetical protein
MVGIRLPQPLVLRLSLSWKRGRFRRPQSRAANANSKGLGKVWLLRVPRFRLTILAIWTGRAGNTLQARSHCLLEQGNKVDAAANDLGKDINGWKVGSIFGARAYFNADWLKRAAAAKFGIYGNDAAEAMYPFITTDENGKPLDASTHSYTLTIGANPLPPVNAFWSIATVGFFPRPAHRLVETVAMNRSAVSRIEDSTARIKLVGMSNITIEIHLSLTAPQRLSRS